MDLVDPPNTTRWCERCKCYHQQKPFDMDKAVARAAKAMSDEIDKSIIQDLLRIK